MLDFLEGMAALFELLVSGPKAWIGLGVGLLLVFSLSHCAPVRNAWCEHAAEAHYTDCQHSWFKRGCEQKHEVELRQCLE